MGMVQEFAQRCAELKIDGRPRRRPPKRKGGARSVPGWLARASPPIASENGNQYVRTIHTLAVPHCCIASSALTVMVCRPIAVAIQAWKDGAPGTIFISMPSTRTRYCTIGPFGLLA